MAMKNKTAAQMELDDMGSTLASIENQMPFKVPAEYFTTSSECIASRIAAMPNPYTEEEITNLSVEIPLERLPTEIMKPVASAEEMPKDSGSARDDDSTGHPIRSMPGPSKWRWSKIASAASIIVLFSVTTLLLVRKPQELPIPVASQLALPSDTMILSPEEIDQYLKETEILEPFPAAITELPSQETLDDLLDITEGNMHNLLAEVDETAILEYMREQSVEID